jgi:hypothetical protein
MVAAVTRQNLTATICCLAGLGIGLTVFYPSNTALAQSSGAFATRPYVLPGETTTVAVVPVPAIAEPVRRQYSIVAQAQRDADYAQAQSEALEAQAQAEIAVQSQYGPQAGVWDPTNLGPVDAPPLVAGVAIPSGRKVVNYAPQSSAQRPYRAPLRRILQDTGRGIVRDVPEGIADALPWVDRDAKNEPFEAVLDRVASDLHRAAHQDPEWALGAQREIRSLSKKLDRFSEPPPMQDIADQGPAGQAVARQSVAGQVFVETNGRPFRPRPIWPGASGRPEAQVRPVTVVTQTGTQDGPQADGVAAQYVPSTDDGSVDAVPIPALKRNPPPRRGRTPRR